MKFPKSTAAEHLANERTFLAWVRTNIALINLGFVLARLSPLIRTSNSSCGAAAANWPRKLRSAPDVNREIEAGLVKTDRGLVWFVTIAMTLLSAALIAYMAVMR